MVLYGLTPKLFNDGFQMPFPMSSCFGVAVQRFLQLHHRLLLTFEGSPKHGVVWPSLWGEMYPARGPFEVGLNVGSRGMRNLSRMARHTAKGIACASGLKGGWATAQILEESDLPTLIYHPVALEDSQAFVFNI